jgi:hypothetical protein
MANISFQKPKEWSKRYILPELASFACALTGAHLAFAAGSNILLASFAAAWAENIGYYSVIIYRETKHISETRPETNRMSRFLLVLRNLAIEFGVAECVDSLFLRPACMFLCFEIFSNHSVATVVGKLLADIGFYTMAVSGYELRKKYLK